MSLILALETSTKNCSVALAEDDRVLAVREQATDGYVHAEKLHVFMDEVMRETQRSFNELSAVAVGAGPGSYTGLRIGVSAAKGFCYTLGIPLISFNGLEILAHQLIASEKLASEALIIPMIDARRMEVYTTIFNTSAEMQCDVEAKIIDETSFLELKGQPVYFIGDGAAKCREVLADEQWYFPDIIFPSAQQLALMAFHKLEEKRFEDVAYFEPFYLKEFRAGKPKKQV